MKRAFRSPLGLRLLASVLALLFVFPPEAMARMSCATLAMLSLPMSCCTMPAVVADTAPEPCCCTTDESSSPDLAADATASVTQAKVRAPDGCCCNQPVARDATTPPVRDASHVNLGAWIAEQAHVSARTVHFECSAPNLRPPSDRDGPVLVFGVLTGGASASPPAVGCARHALLARGVVGLLTDFGIALL